MSLRAVFLTEGISLFRRDGDSIETQSAVEYGNGRPVKLRVECGRMLVGQFKAAVIQEMGIPGDSEASARKACALVARAGSEGAGFVLFPEAFLGGYPKGADFGTRLGIRTDEGRDAFRKYFEEAIEVPGPETELIADAARKAKVTVVMGVVERAGATLYCTAICINEAGELIGTRRKVMPTALERVIWGFGDGSTLQAWQTSLGTIGAAICWENYMPLLRTALYSQGVQIYCAPTVDDRETWIPTVRHIAMEGRCFVFSACQFVPGESPGGVTVSPVIRGGSCVVNPFGRVIAGPVYGEPTILIADIDLGEIARGKFDLDTTGHYARPDIFQLQVNRAVQTPVEFQDLSHGT